MTLWRYFHTFLLSSVAVIYLIHNQLKRKKRFTIEQLHRAAALGDISQLKTILGAGQVPVNRRNEEGTTPLMLAIANGHKECAEILLKHHADPAIRRITGTHALYFACQSGLSHMVNLLIDYGVQVDQPAYESTTALFVAVEDDHREIVRLLLKNGADVNKRAGSGYTPLMLAVKYNYVDVAEMLLDFGADPNCVMSRDGCTPLLLAVMMNFVEMASLLASYGARINTADPGCDTPLYRAIRHGSLELILSLLSFKPPPNPHAGPGQTCLHAAVLRGDLTILNALLEAGHTLSSCDEEVCSEIQYAKLLKMQEIENTLVKHAHLKTVSKKGAGDEVVRVKKTKVNRKRASVSPMKVHAR